MDSYNNVSLRESNGGFGQDDPVASIMYYILFGTLSLLILFLVSWIDNLTSRNIRSITINASDVSEDEDVEFTQKGEEDK